MVLAKFWTSAGTNIFPTIVNQTQPDNDLLGIDLHVHGIDLPGNEKAAMIRKFEVAQFRVGGNYLGTAGAEVV
jgi:hypothetical protein